jgi:hypothetical protein
LNGAASLFLGQQEFEKPQVLWIVGERRMSSRALEVRASEKSADRRRD